MRLNHIFLYQLFYFAFLFALSTRANTLLAQEADLIGNSIAENQEANSVVGSFIPTSAEFNLTAGVADNASFIIDDGILLAKAPLNYEEQEQYTLRVDITFTTVAGTDSLVAAQPFMITVEDLNDPPVVTGQSPLTTPYQTPLTLELSALQIEDEDNDDPTGFTLQAARGENYTVTGQVVTPAPTFSGTLSVPVTVSDGEDDSEPFLVSIMVAAPEKKEPVFNLADDDYSVDEDFSTPIRVVAEPEDRDQVVTYQIVPEAVDFATLTADNTNGVYVFSSLPDRNGEENFTITATNEQNNFFERVFTFRVNPVNDPPTFAGVAGSDQQVLVGSELVTIPNFATSIAAGPITAVDEENQTVTFEVTSSTPELFARGPVIDPAGTLTFQPVDDNIGTAQVRVALIDNGKNKEGNQNTSSIQSFNIEILAPEEPQDFDIDSREINENEAPGTTVGTFTRSGDYYIVGGPAQNLFAINGQSLVTQDRLNFENPNQKNLDVRVERRYGLFNAARERESFIITVLNVEEPPTSVTLAGGSVAEGAAISTPVGTLSAVGGAPEVPPTFAFVPGPGGEDNGRFIISGNQLLINEVPDFEAKAQYAVQLQAIGDGASPPQTFTITVTNTAEPPTSILLTNSTVEEGRDAGTPVGTFSVEGGSTTAVTYTLSGPDAASFTVTGGTLATSAVFDAETKASYAITVTATGDGQYSQDFTITVTNVPEPPTAISLNNNSVAEGAPVGTTVGTLSATGGEPVTTYELVPGAGADDNGQFSLEGTTLSTTEIFDFETKNSYTIRVRATGDGAFEQALIINVTDQPDPPTAIQLSSNAVRENQPAGTVIGNLTASGGAGPYTFALAGNQADNSGFRIEGNELSTARPFNFEASSTQDIVVQASNADGDYEQAFTINIVNEEEPPTNIALSSSSIRENAPPETVIGTLSATGGGNEITYELVGGEGSADNSQFEIVGNSLRSRVAFNFEAQSEYSVRVRATGDGSYAQALTITVVNEPEPPTEITLSSTSIAENEPAGTVVGTLSAVGGAGAITFSLVGNNQNFQIEGNRLLTSVVFDREARPSPDYPVRIRATGDGSLVSSFVITVVDINEPPVLSEIESTFLEYAEGQAATTITNSIRVDDPENDQLTTATISFSNNTYINGEDELLLTANGVGSEWSPATGRLVIRGPLSRVQMQDALRSVQYRNLSTVNPTPSTRRVSFQVSDGNSSSNQQERFIRVSDSNIPPVLTDIVVSTPEDNEASITRDNFADAYGGDEDGSGFSGTVSILTLPSQGSLSVGNSTLTDADIRPPGFELNLNDNSVFLYTPDENYSGTDGFQWTAYDNENESGIPANVTISILPRNDAPVINAPPTISIEEDTDDPLTDITVNDPDNDSLFITLVVDQGELTIAEELRSEITLVTGTGEGDTEIAFGGSSNTINDVLANMFYYADGGSTTLTVTLTDIPEDGSESLTADASITLTVIPQNDNPVLSSIATDPLVFVENSDPLLIAETLQVTDEENDAIVAAVVAIDSGYTEADSLIFEDTSSITATLSEGILTLTGTASVEDYQAALRSVAFKNSSDQPETSPRYVRFVVTDATGGQSNSQIRVITVTSVEDTLQVVNIEPEPLYYIIGSPPTEVSRTVELDDPDSETMDRLVVSLVADSYNPTDDSLGTTASGAISIDWDAAQGELTISGVAPIAEYEQALRSLTYYNRNAGAAEDRRQLLIQGFSGETASNVATREIQIINNIAPVVNDVPIVVLTGSPYVFADSVFQAYYRDEDNRPSEGGFASIQITSLPQNGTLFLNEAPLTQADIRNGLFISADDLAQLSYVSNQGYLGEDQFGWNASDGAELAESPALVIITVADLQVTLGNDIEKCLNIDSVQLEAFVEGGTPPYRYIWSSDQEESIPKNGSIVAVLPTDTTKYTVTVTDADGITVNSTVQVNIINCPEQELSIPSAFTPDGDGINDVWEIGNILSYESNVVEIYDRYGHLLLRSEGYDQPWDGRYQGEILPTGTYYYSIILNEGAAYYKGAITILK